MKSLDQVASTGIAINATNTPGDAAYEAVISAPGSYYLTGNLGVNKTNGIHVTVGGVTVDLNGFQIARASGSGGGGVLINIGADNVVVQNGSIDGFASGSDGIASTGGAFLRLSVSHCTSIGLRGGNGWKFEGCRAHDNTLSQIAIQAASGSTLSNCTAQNNTCSTAISTDAGCTLTNCSAISNSGPVGNGFQVGDGSTLTNCSATSNTGIGFDLISAIAFGAVATNCAAIQNGLFGFSCRSATITGCIANGNFDGIVCEAGCVVSNNTSDYNAEHGFKFYSSNVVTGNNASKNGSNGFISTGSLNRIDGNSATGNGGVGFLWVNDFVVRNTSFANTGGNYKPAVGVFNTGPVQAASSATNAWANF